MTMFLEKLKMFQWFLRDLTGMLGGVLFTCYQGSNLDSNAKMWRLVADLMNDLGMLFHLNVDGSCISFISISFCVHRLHRELIKVIQVGAVSMNCLIYQILHPAETGVASGATRAALTQHFALENNAADIAAKEGSQETLATMIGMALGMLLARLTIGHSFAIWISFLSLTMFHMYANYKAVCCLSLNTLNCERCSIVLSHFLKTGQVLSPKQVSSMEHVLPLWMTSWNLNGGDSLYKQVRLGVRVSSLDSLAMVDLLQSAGSHYKKEKYLLQQKGGIIRIITHKDSAGADILQSFIHALVMAKLDDQDGSMSSESQSWMDKHYEVFVLKLQSSGWKTERLLSSSVVWRANWLVNYSDGKHD
ncbi:hypothetical protein H5410_025046 [Solanum commersonii]|uniref:Protein root UVB sensitive 3 n=1 Tax=Solanum commersonii TaxID=4109 RepID=A0A9J5YT48_SOLCO|nr:hypothetical protein H5410_025046 [Solanum commersonii]